MTAVRVRFEQGRLLASDDLAADVDFESTQIERHVRAVHDAFGIAAGYSVALDAFIGTGVFVGPGLAYDRHGRLLASDATVHVPAEEADGPIVLVARPSDSTSCCSGPDGAPSCHPRLAHPGLRRRRRGGTRAFSRRARARSRTST